MKTITSDYWLKKTNRLNRTVSKYMPLYLEICRKYPTLSLPEDFQYRTSLRINILAGTLPYHPGGDRNSFNGLMPVLGLLAAAHTELRDAGWTVDQIGRLTYEICLMNFLKTPKLFRRIQRKVIVSGLFGKIMKPACRQMNESKNHDTFHLAFKYSHDPAPLLEVKCTQCAMITFMKNNNLPEMYSYCNIFDFAQADALNLGLVQPKCIGWGDSVCLYHYSKNPADTRYPRNVKRIISTEM